MRKGRIEVEERSAINFNSKRNIAITLRSSNEILFVTITIRAHCVFYEIDEYNLSTSIEKFSVFQQLLC